MRIFKRMGTCSVILALMVSVVLIPVTSWAKPADEQTVVLISLDGFRWDYVEKHGASSLAEMARQGVRAERMQPVYPTKTFPNHLSLITGLYPTHHGIVDNHFCDKVRNECYDLGDGHNDSSWLSGIPLWNLAELQGLISATYFWPESDARFGGKTPTYYYPYSHNADPQERIDQIIRWLQLPSDKRPRFIASYFHQVDSAGHEFGPSAPQTKAAVKYLDGLIGQLRQRLKTEVKQPVNLVIVADHGMTDIKADQAIDYRELNIPESFKVVNASTRLMIYATPKTSADELKALQQQFAKDTDPRFFYMTQEALHQRHFEDSPRVADIILETKAPRYFTNKDANKRHDGGTHGFTYFADMGAVFIAEGPAFKQGIIIPEFPNLDVYPTIAKILGIKLLSKVDGDGKGLEAALK